MSTDTTLERSGQAATALGNPAEPNQEIQTSTVGADGTAPQPTSVQLGVDPNEPVIPSDEVISRETFIPVTKFALLDRLTRPQAWDAGEATDARRFFRYLAYWRQQQYNTAVMKLDHAYEPFSPDSDLLMTRQYTDGERAAMQSRVVAGMRHMLQQANYTCIDRSEAELILTSDSHYGLDFDVDLNAFEELEIYYRGASTKKDQKRTFRKFFRKEEFDVPIFQRLFILFKLKSEEQRIEEYMRTRTVTRQKAEKAIRAASKHIPDGVSRDLIYMKLFKNMPRADVEMIFPNTKVKFRLLDKIKLGVTGGGAIGMGLVGTVGKFLAGGLALLSNPIALAAALFGLGGVLFRQVMGFFNTRQRYMVVMAQNLYFHALADNRGCMITLADRAAEEDVKEEMLLYSVLAKETVRRQDLKSVDEAVEQYLTSAFGVTVDFDLDDALGRLMQDGVVTEQPDGTLYALPPKQAGEHIDAMWDVLLDNLPDGVLLEGTEFEGESGGTLQGPESQPREVHVDTV